MPRLSRTSSASSESYSTLPTSLDTSHASMPYYHHGRVASLSGSGYYDQIPEGVPSPAALGSSSMAAQAAAYQQDPFAVGPPLTMGGGGGGPTTVITSSSNGGSSSRGGALRASAGGSRGSYPVQHPRTSSGAWSPQDDDALISARARGENWATIQTQFPGKTPNACRKRHERLMERRNADDFDTRKMEHIAREYMNLRREIWQPLAQRTGEKWTVVEQKCMASGLKNLQGVSRAAARRERLEAGYAVVGAYTDDDLGGPGGPGDVDLLDGGGGGSSPGGSTNGGGGSHGGSHRSVSGGSNSSTVSLQTHHPLSGPASLGGGPSSSSRHHRHSHSHSQHHLQQQHPSAHHQQQHHHLQVPSGGSPVAAQDVGSPTYQDYYSTTAGFSQSLRSMEVGGGGVGGGSGAQHVAMASPYMTASHHPHHPQHHHRLSAADMGIDSLLHRR